MLRYFTKVRIGAETCDVHVRTEQFQSGERTDYQLIAFCGVYVHPVGPVPGYWYFPAGEDARTILRALGAA